MQEELGGGLAAVMPAVNPVFFGIVGASVRVVSPLDTGIFYHGMERVDLAVQA